MTLPVFVAPAVIKKFLKSAWPFMLAAVVGLVLLLTYCEGKRPARARADLARERGNVETLENKSAADDSAAGARLTDAERRAQEQAELLKVTNNANNPADRRRAFHRCLREQQAARKAGRPAHPPLELPRSANA